eukprot:1158873-Pelagomonas_calceolata.AAC.8
MHSTLLLHSQVGWDRLQPEADAKEAGRAGCSSTGGLKGNGVTDGGWTFYWGDALIWAEDFDRF